MGRQDTRHQLFGEDIGVKLDREGRTELAALPGGGPFGPAERPMGGYASLPTDLPDAGKTAFRLLLSSPSQTVWSGPNSCAARKECGGWIRRALDYVSTLPHKTPKASRKSR